MRRLLLALLGLVGVGASYAQPTLYARDVLDLIMEDRGGLGEELFLGQNGGFVHPDYPEITINVLAHQFRTGFVPYGDPVTAAIECGAFRNCYEAGSDLILYGWQGLAWRETWSVCAGEKPLRAVVQPNSGSGNDIKCLSVEAAFGAAVSLYWDSIVYGVKDYTEMTGSWARGSLPPTVTLPSHVSVPSRETFNATVWSKVTSGVANWSCAVEGVAVCTVEALEEFGVFIDGSYVDGGYSSEDPDGTGGGGNGGGGGSGGTDWQEGKHRTRCDGTGELNIFEKALFFAFEPCEPWAERFIGLRDDAYTKQPLAFIGWMNDAIECTEYDVFVGEVTPCQVYGGAVYWWRPTIPGSFTIGNREIPIGEVDLTTTPFWDWMVNVGRPILLGMMWIAGAVVIVRGFMQ